MMTEERLSSPGATSPALHPWLTCGGKFSHLEGLWSVISGADGGGLWQWERELLMLELRATATLTSRKAENFSTCTKCASFTLSQKCQNGKDLISAHWGVQKLPPSLSSCQPGQVPTAGFSQESFTLLCGCALWFTPA